MNMTSPHDPGPDFEAVARLQAELKSESPRGIILISAAMLEEALRELIASFLVPNANSNDTLLEGTTAPLGSFSAKIDAAYRFGLVSDKFCRDLHLIRRIRNEVAHKPQGFSFEDSSARDRILALSKSHGLFERSPKWVEKTGKPNLEAQFLEAATWMLFFLAAERERVKSLRARIPEFGYLATMDEESGLPKNAV